MANSDARSAIPVLLLASALSLAGSASSYADGADIREIQKRENVCPPSPYYLRDACIKNIWDQEDRRMNVLYKYLMKEVPTPKDIQKAQRAWLSYRDAECPSVDPKQTAEPQAFYGQEFECKAALTRERNRLLEWHIAHDCPDYVDGTDCPSQGLLKGEGDSH